jgi:MFS transporter, DHA1 family, multidrug resistance protein
MTVLLASLTAMGPLATDIYVASLPQIARAFEASTASVQLTITCYLIGFAAGQIVYGPFSDKFGRRPLMLIGFALYLLATLGCILSISAPMLIGARVLQALGAAGPIILTRAIVRDLYEGPRAARQYAVMSMIMGVTPIGAPVLGGFLQFWFGWQASFFVMAGVGLTLATCVTFLLPETNKRKLADPISIAGILGSFAIVARNKAYLSYLGIQACSYNGLFAFVSSSSIVLQGSYGLTPVQFGFVFACCSSSYVAGAFVGARLATRRGLEGMIGLGAAWLCAGGVTQIVGVTLFPGSILAVVLPDMAYFVGVGFLLPNTLAAALTPFPDRAGAASSLMGFVQMTSGAIVGSIVGAQLGASAMPLAAVTFIAGVGAFSIFHASKAARANIPVRSGKMT